MIRIKPGVRIEGIRPEIIMAINVAEALYTLHNTELVINKVTDRPHSPGSLHYIGQAVDLRISDLSRGEVGAIATELRIALGRQFNVVVKSDHIHVEFQPKE